MSLNIKHPEAHAMARRIAELTGETLTEAVNRALSDRLARLEDRDGAVEALLAIGRDCARRLKGAVKTKDHGELLYDETGLPR